MDIDSFILYIKTDDIFKDIVGDTKTGFDTSNYELARPFLKGKTEKVIGLMKNDLGGKILIKLVGPKAKTYSYLINYVSEDKKAKGTEKVS